MFQVENNVVFACASHTPAPLCFQCWSPQAPDETPTISRHFHDLNKRSKLHSGHHSDPPRAPPVFNVGLLFPWPICWRFCMHISRRRTFGGKKWGTPLMGVQSRRGAGHNIENGALRSVAFRLAELRFELHVINTSF